MRRFDPSAVRDHFDSIARRYDEGKARQSYYWETLVEIYRERVPPGSSVLDVGCGTGTLLASLRPARGLGLDISPGMIAAALAKFPAAERPELAFRVEDVADGAARGARPEAAPFERILLCDVLEHLPDPGAALEGLKPYADASTRFVATAANPLWAGVLHLGEALGLKLPEGDHEWMTLRRIEGLLDEHGYAVETAEGRMLAPVRLPLLSPWLNRLARSPRLRPLCLVYAVVFRLC